MKTRLTLVSNSSTTSFCIYGICTEIENDAESIFKLLQKIVRNHYDKYVFGVDTHIKGLTESDQCNEKWAIDKINFLNFMKTIPDTTLEYYISVVDPDEEYGDGDVEESLREELDSALSYVGLSCHRGPDGYESFYIGRDFTSIGDNETGAQFKNSIKELISTIFSSSECTIHEESWQNG